jgi:hypothetical protein
MADDDHDHDDDDDYMSEQENTGDALNICLGPAMFNKPPLRAVKDQSPKHSNSGTPDRGQHYYKRQTAPISSNHNMVQN